MVQEVCIVDVRQGTARGIWKNPERIREGSTLNTAVHMSEMAELYRNENLSKGKPMIWKRIG